MADIRVAGYPYRVEFARKPSLLEIRDAVNAALSSFSAKECDYLRSIGSELNPVADAMHQFITDSGKRLRPIFAYVGFLGTGASADQSIVNASAALELVHVCALMHDDVMDGSDTRRGAPSIHRAFEALHNKESLQGSAAQYGISAAILLGDLALIWSAKALHTSGISDETLIRAQAMYDEMRIELMAGQYLDIHEGALATQSVERSLKVARYKSGKYTIERPLHFGAALGTSKTADSHSELQRVYSSYGLPLGEAFQLRDDVMGVFGNPEETGKPAGDDIREGKRTVLMAKAFELISPTEAAVLTSALGNPALSVTDVERVRAIISESGALDQLEHLISGLTDQAVTSLDSTVVHPDARDLLTELATVVTRRKS